MIYQFNRYSNSDDVKLTEIGEKVSAKILSDNNCHGKSPKAKCPSSPISFSESDKENMENQGPHLDTSLQDEQT